MTLRARHSLQHSSSSPEVLDSHLRFRCWWKARDRMKASVSLLCNVPVADTVSSVRGVCPVFESSVVGWPPSLTEAWSPRWAASSESCSMDSIAVRYWVRAASFSGSSRSGSNLSVAVNRATVRDFENRLFLKSKGAPAIECRTYTWLVSPRVLRQ